MWMMTVKGPGNKAPVELLTHPQMKLRYRASNWANNAVFSCYCIVIFVKLMGPYLKDYTVKTSKHLHGNSRGPWE